MTTIGPDQISACTLPRLLRSAFGRSGDVTSCRVISKSKDYAVIAATLADPVREVVVKLAGPEATLPCPFARTAAIVGLVRSCTAVPTFEVLAVDVSYRAWPWHYMVMTAVPGARWADVRPGSTGEQGRGLDAALGRTVAQLHTMRFPSCGEVGADGRVEDGATHYEALVVRARRRIANPEHASLFTALLREHAELFAGMRGGALCHEDLNPYNILVPDEAGGQPTVSVLDFDSAWAGCPESDLARLEFWRGMVGEGFWEAYRAGAPVDSRYPERRPFYQLLWCLEYARATPQHIADTAAVCRSLGIPPVTFK